MELTNENPISLNRELRILYELGLPDYELENISKLRQKDFARRKYH